MLEREYQSVEPHIRLSVAEDDSNAVWAESYSELQSAILAQVKAHQEVGVIRLKNWKGDVEEQLTRACDEISHSDPLGAYAVDRIQHSFTRMVSYYEATITIDYRRSAEQIAAVTTVTGSGAIRAELLDALDGFVPETVFQINYFDETQDADYIRNLIREAYYDLPAAALGMPEAQVNLYPDAGSRRVVEVLLTYPEDTQALRQKSDDLQSTADALVLPLRPHQLSPSARQAELFSLVREHVRARPEGGPTAWDALLGDGADSEGLALAFQLLSGKMEVGSVLVEGTLNGEPHFWNQLTADGGAHYVDLTRDASGTTYSAADLLSLGYVWEGAEENAENLN